jgi:hypothetical protein
VFFLLSFFFLLHLCLVLFIRYCAHPLPPTTSRRHTLYSPKTTFSICPPCCRCLLKLFILMFCADWCQWNWVGWGDSILLPTLREESSVYYTMLKKSGHSISARLLLLQGSMQ